MSVTSNAQSLREEPISPNTSIGIFACPFCDVGIADEYDWEGGWGWDCPACQGSGVLDKRRDGNFGSTPYGSCVLDGWPLLRDGSCANNHHLISNERGETDGKS